MCKDYLIKIMFSKRCIFYAIIYNAYKDTSFIGGRGKIVEWHYIFLS